MEQNPLVKLYGSDVFDLALEEIRKLQCNSNIPFDKSYLELGTSFMQINASDILSGKESKCSLSILVSKSFGEAAIYRYNVI